MRIGIQTWGSRGDIMPLLALADGLQEADHDVTVSITSIDDTDYSETAQRLALTVRYVGGPVIESAPERARVQAAVFAQANPLKQAQMIVDNLLEPVADQMFGEAERLCRENDLVIGHFFHYPLRIAAELAGRPYASVMLAHSVIPSRFAPPSGLPDWGQTVNRAWWWITRKLLNKYIKPFPDRMRTAHDMAPARDLIDDVWTSPELNLIAVSGVLCAHQDDWGAQHRICGEFGFRDATAEHTPDARLEAFLNAGPPPVYVSFGSVMSNHATQQKDTIDVLMQAAHLASCRMIIQAPLRLAHEPESRDTVLFVDQSAHHAVFPRCGAVVHHGGAGTTHTALRAGVPSVVVAHIDEQQFWGRELHRIGAAPAPLLKRTWSAQALAQRIQTALNDENIRTRARTAASVMRTETPIARAVAAISDHFRILK
ncbi:glycosyltransferase [Magnetovibrio sp.]|uniref:glycosyltransferase n=1 Tax=Magnetovibrio sp. TaxID=2024836 RepID=UPI002F923873